MSSIHTYDKLTDDQVLLAEKTCSCNLCQKTLGYEKLSSNILGIIQGTQNPLSQNFILSAQSINEINDNGDLQKWSNWASDRHSIDFLN